ncbi:MAG: HDIG domain-containing metalloprotein [Candidatus Zixiibacteriota bacterium]
MYSLLLKLKRSIKRLLKVQSDTRVKYVPSARSRTIKILLLVATSILIGLAYPGEDLFNPLDMPHRGDISAADVLAPFQIVVYKSQRELDEEHEMVKNSIPYVINKDTATSQNVYTSLNVFVNLIDSLRVVPIGPGPEAQADRDEAVAARFPFISQTAITKALSSPESIELLRLRLERIYAEEIYNIGVMQDLNALPVSRQVTVTVRQGERESVYPRDRLLDLALANGRLLTALNRLGATDSIDVEFYYLIGRGFLQPNLWVDMAEYNRRVNESMAQISPVKETLNTGDIIVRAGMRVGDRQEAVLNELARIRHSKALSEGWPVALWPVIARILLVLAAFGIQYLFLFYFRPDTFRSNPRLLALFLVFVLQLLLVYIVKRLGIEHGAYLYPIAVLPIMVTVLYDAEIGMLSTIILALLLGVLHRFDFTLSLMTIVIGTVACFTSREVRKRSHFYRIMFSVMLAYVALIYVVETLKLSPRHELAVQIGFGAAAAFFSSILTIGILPVFESMFGITTDITLLELSDLNHPLLKRLALEAPGTYHHSISVGNLSEAAAKAIGANALLARVGCYYHDIGKIEIPEYFVENQLSVKSRHEALSPSMSSLILSAHVKRGRLLGEEADIPDDVLNFIEEHHGTMVMTYFYNKALEQGTDPASMDKFRYPGPRPQTRETGIAMLADAVEAASRTLDDPKPARIQSLIQRIINDRFQSGELDECPLTLRDLARIREAFAQMLIGAFHQRVAYPQKEKGRV